MKIKITNMLLAAMALFYLSGCASLLTSNEDPPSIYVLNALPEASVEAEFDRQLYIETPEVPPGFNTEKIAVVKASRELDFLVGAEWSDKLDSVLHSYLFKSYENRLPLGSVFDENLRVNPEYVLSASVRDFEARYVGYEAEEAPEIHVSIVFTLYNRQNEVVADKIVVERVVRAQSNSVRAIVDAFEMALNDVTEESLVQLFYE